MTSSTSVITLSFRRLVFHAISGGGETVIALKNGSSWNQLFVESAYIVFLLLLRTDSSGGRREVGR